MDPSSFHAAAATVDYAPLILTGVGTAIVTFLAGLFGAWIQSRREVRRWQLQLRYEAYRAVLVEADFLHLGVTRGASAERFTPEDRKAAAEAVSGIGLVGPAKLYQAAVDYQIKVVDLIGVKRELTNQEWALTLHARNELAIAMQKALMVPRSQRFNRESVEAFKAQQDAQDAARGG